jgi:hypothetical protein
LISGNNVPQLSTITSKFSLKSRKKEFDQLTVLHSQEGTEQAHREILRRGLSLLPCPKEFRTRNGLWGLVGRRGYMRLPVALRRMTGIFSLIGYFKEARGKFRTTQHHMHANCGISGVFCNQ